MFLWHSTRAKPFSSQCTTACGLIQAPLSDHLSDMASLKLCSGWASLVFCVSSFGGHSPAERNGGHSRHRRQTAAVACLQVRQWAVLAYQTFNCLVYTKHSYVIGSKKRPQSENGNTKTRGTVGMDAIHHSRRRIRHQIGLGQSLQSLRVSERRSSCRL